MITYAFGEGLYDDKACKDGTVHPKIKSVKDVVKEPFWLKGGRFIHSVGMLVLYVVFGLMVSANGPVSHTIVLNEAMRTVIIIWLGYMATAHVGMAHGFDLFCAGFLGDAQPPHDNTTLMLLNMCQNYFGMICVLCMMLLSLDKVPLAMMWVLIWMVCANLRADFYWLFGKSLGPRDEPQPRRLTFALSDLPLVLITLSILVHGVFTLEKTT